jgi:hypothetical protein
MPRNMPLEEGIGGCKRWEDQDCPVEAWVDVRLQRNRLKLRLFVSRVNKRADKLHYGVMKGRYVKMEMFKG